MNAKRTRKLNHGSCIVHFLFFFFFQGEFDAMCLFVRKGIGEFPKFPLPSNRNQTQRNHKEERSAMHVCPLR